MEKIGVLRCFFVKYTNISFKCISCMIVPRSGNGLWVNNCNGWQASHICRRGTVDNVEKFISQFSFQNLSTPVPMSNRIFCFVLHFSFSLHKNKSICFLTIFRFADLAKKRLSAQTIWSFKLFLMSRSRSCEIISSMCFLHFGESLGTASNKQEDLMMN